MDVAHIHAASLNTLFTQFDDSLKFYLRHLYSDATLPEVRTRELTTAQSLGFSTSFQFKKFFASEENSCSVMWSLKEWTPQIGGSAVLRFVLQQAIPWLDKRMTRCDALSDIDIFNSTIHCDRIEFVGWGDLPPRSPANFVHEHRTLQWYEIITERGRENAARAKAEEVVPETMDLQ